MKTDNWKTKNIYQNIKAELRKSDTILFILDVCCSPREPRTRERKWAAPPHDVLDWERICFGAAEIHSKCGLDESRHAEQHCSHRISTHIFHSRRWTGNLSLFCAVCCLCPDVFAGFRRMFASMNGKQRNWNVEKEAGGKAENEEKNRFSMNEKKRDFQTQTEKAVEIFGMSTACEWIYVPMRHRLDAFSA